MDGDRRKYLMSSKVHAGVMVTSTRLILGAVTAATRAQLGQRTGSNQSEGALTRGISQDLACRQAVKVRLGRVA